MTCSQIKELIYTYIDGELDLLHSLEIERHLEKCQECKIIHKNLELLQSSVSSDSLYFNQPEGFSNQLMEKLRISNGYGRKWSFFADHIKGLSAAAIIAAITIFIFIPSLSIISGDQPLINDLVNSHIRSLLADHITDVTTSDRHKVKPWFNGKLNFSPRVEDFTKQGFPLVGGRLDYIDNRTVASLVYKRRLHFINLYIWPSEHKINTNIKFKSDKGYNLLSWNESEMMYWAVSDLNKSELEEFARLVQNIKIKY